MPSAFIGWSSRRISGCSTAVPNHHQRIMGFVVAGGFWKFCFKFAVDVFETKRIDVDDVRRSASRKCGANGWLERGEMRGKRGMVLLLFAGGLGFLLGLQVRRGWNRDEGDEAGSGEGGERSIHGNGCEGCGATL